MKNIKPIRTHDLAGHPIPRCINGDGKAVYAKPEMLCYQCWQRLCKKLARQNPGNCTGSIPLLDE